MTVTSIAQYISDVVAVALVIRLLLLRLHTVYRVFCAFLLVDVLSSLLFFVTRAFHHVRLDYRLVWLTLRPLVWVLALWMVYALLDAMLANLPGILEASRKVLNVAFIVALVLAFLTAWPEYSASGLAASPDPINRLLGAGFVVERVIFMAAVLVLLAIVGFTFWFPVEMPRNLVVFSIGFAVFFSLSATGLFLQTYWQSASVRVVSDILTFALAACYTYWLLFINRAGERVSVRPGHSWQPGQQQRMIAELEAMNAALLRASHR